MKKSSALAIITILIFIASFSCNIKFTRAQTYNITKVDHTVEILHNGYMVINDTIELTGTAPESFFFGFPYIYGSYILTCVAYDSNNIFPINLNVPLANQIGFYGVKVNLTQGTQVFTVMFVLSNDLLNISQTRYTLDFPAYPAFTESVGNCSVSIVLPADASSVIVVKDDGIVNASTYSRELSAFTYSPAKVTFFYGGGKLKLFDVKELKREIRIGGLGEIECLDSYYISSKSSSSIDSIEVVLPPNATNRIANDEFGRKMSNVEVVDSEKNIYKVKFSLPLESYRSTRFSVKYSLPSQVYISAQEGANNFNASSLLFKNMNCYIETASVSFTLPEGARILTSENVLMGSSCYISRSVFQETITINKQGIAYLENVLPLQNALQIVYEFNPLWLSFRPTLVIWALAVLGLTVGVAWKKSKAAAVRVAAPIPTVAVRLRPEYIKSFVNAYEEKRKIVLELESLETRVRKGKIPRRRYKVQRKTLETRLNSLSKSLAEYKEKMRAAGGLYADLMRQLEVAETEINEVEASSRSIEARHSRGELSLEAYRKLLADYQRRKEKAETTINGILLRLREEIAR
ncbi:MAG: hypothetical protein ACUVTB_00535 [Candidatus Bathycorpusculaceae bacterium]